MPAGLWQLMHKFAFPPARVNCIPGAVWFIWHPLHILWGGHRLTVTGKFDETAPVPQALVPLTVRFPDVADAEKDPLMEDEFPEGVNPVPE